MNPKHLSVRAKSDDGTIWITEERYRKPIKPLKDVTNDVMLALCADLSSDNETHEVERDIRFSDGMVCRITVTMLEEFT